VRRLLDVVGPRTDEFFLEIGSGRGALTLPLAARAKRVMTVELDPALVAGLRAKAPANVEVIHGDALTLDLESLLPRGGRVVGNLPYYISSPLLRRLLDLHGRVRDLHVMVQREVAGRVASPPGSKEYGILSVLFGLWADLDIPLRFPPGAFDPPPRVDSALLRARFRDTPRASVTDPQAFERLVQASFAHRRQTLEKNLRDSYPNLKKHWSLLKITGTRRAETLSVVEFARLSEALVLD
jgi:16S rRNA (adenine1518-N6/adenine1519-N6)-dimethyltransferase